MHDPRLLWWLEDAAISICGPSGNNTHKEKLLELHAALTSGQLPANFFADGPTGAFFTDSRLMAEKILATPHDRDEWTITDISSLRSDDAKNANRWKFYAANSPQTAVMLGTDKDPNDDTVDWLAECNRLVDEARRKKHGTPGQ